MIKPVNKNILLKIEQQPSETIVNGIYLQQKPDTKENIARVVELSEDIPEHIKKQVKVNDLIIYKSYSGTKFEHEDQNYVIIDAEDVLSVIN